MVKGRQSLGWRFAEMSPNPGDQGSVYAPDPGVWTEAQHIQEGFNPVQLRDKLLGNYRPQETPGYHQTTPPTARHSPSGATP